MSKCYKYSLEDKLDAIRLYVRLKNASEVGRITGICVPLVTIWYRQYQAGGPHALRIQSHGNKYNFYDRVSITEELLKKELPLTEASAVFGVSIRTLRRWVTTVNQKGFTGLYDHIPSIAVPIMAKKRKNRGEPMSELEQLKKENLRLRAELDLIKKVEALVSERCKRITESVQKPSKS